MTTITKSDLNNYLKEQEKLIDEIDKLHNIKVTLNIFDLIILLIIKFKRLLFKNIKEK